MPLPRPGYRWRWARTDAPGWSEDGSAPKVGSWIPVAKAHAAKDSDTITVDTGTIRDKTPAEVSAADLKTKRHHALAKAIDAELQLLGLNALKSRLLAAGKRTGKIQAKIDDLAVKMTKAIGNLL